MLCSTIIVGDDMKKTDDSTKKDDLISLDFSFDEIKKMDKINKEEEMQDLFTAIDFNLMDTMETPIVNGDRNE